jgi:hypothetical protein
MSGNMRLFTSEQIKAHFPNVRYAYSSTFFSLLLKNRIIVRMSFNAYAYDFDRMSLDILDLIIEECKENQTKYQRRYHEKTILHPR